MTASPHPSLVSVQHDVRAHFGWSYEGDLESALGLQMACDDHPAAQRLGWLPSQREETLRAVETILHRASTVVVVGAAVETVVLEQSFDEGTVFVAADGAVGACLGRVDVACVVTDLDGEPHLSNAAREGVPFIVHAHGDNTKTWRKCIDRWATSGGPRLVLTHQTDEAIPGMHNPGGFTDGDRAACFLSWLDVPPEKIRWAGFATDRVGPWSGATDPERKLAKLSWMERVLRCIDARWDERCLENR
ncbi:MAG: hypothetical protein VXX90_02580 [Candidatus Thermoplasmatota archaeon]|nr:hypothetical protein [Candidatus Thermoplasmatota archaeon]